jgi:uncharacterized protein
MRVLAAFGIVLALAATPAVAGDFEDGVKFAESKDYARAISSFRKAAARGDAKAQNNLGFMYSEGQGVARDYKQAMSWYRKAAAQGDAGAQNNLGLIYYKGEGVAQDYYVEAYKWWTLAGENGYADARKSRETVEKLMTREQIAEAQRRASEWVKAHK